MQKLQKDIPICYFWLADLFAHTGDMKRAKLCYLKVYAQTKNASCLYQLAIAYKNQVKVSDLAQAKIYALQAIQAF